MIPPPRIRQTWVLETTFPGPFLWNVDGILGIVTEGEGLIEEYKGTSALVAALLDLAQASNIMKWLAMDIKDVGK